MSSQSPGTPIGIVATLLWPSVGVKPNTSKVGDLESSGTPKCLELDSKAQNTSHWGVLGIVGKVLKRRYRKWHRIGHLEICRPSYGQKKGRESNWQFDSQPLKVGNRYLPDLLIESVIRRWKDLDEGYKFGCSLDRVSQRILYGGRWWLPPSSGRGVSRGPKCPWLVLTPKGVPKCELTTWVVFFYADSSLIY